MRGILADILTLLQYQDLMERDEGHIRPERCLCCGRLKPWGHGVYPRQSDRLNKSGESLNPILIQRYYCPACKKTCSVLPECIPPHRWYLWSMQQTVLLLWLAGESAYAIAKKVLPSQQTIVRWMSRFEEQFHLHKDALCACFINLGRTHGLAEFWQTCLESMVLGKAMRICHLAGVSIP